MGTDRSEKRLRSCLEFLSCKLHRFPATFKRFLIKNSFDPDQIGIMLTVEAIF